MRFKTSDISQDVSLVADVDLDMIDLYQESLELLELENEIDEAVHSFEIYDAICNCIKEEGGVSKSLEILFGENFASTASMETEAEEQRKAWYVRFFEKIKEWVERLKKLFSKLFAKEAFAPLKKGVKKFTDFVDHVWNGKEEIVIHPYILNKENLEYVQRALLSFSKWIDEGKFYPALDDCYNNHYAMYSSHLSVYRKELEKTADILRNNGIVSEKLHEKIVVNSEEEAKKYKDRAINACELVVKIEEIYKASSLADKLDGLLEEYDNRNHGVPSSPNLKTINGFDVNNNNLSEINKMSVEYFSELYAVFGIYQRCLMEYKRFFSDYTSELDKAEHNVKYLGLFTLYLI